MKVNTIFLIIFMAVFGLLTGCHSNDSTSSFSFFSMKMNIGSPHKTVGIQPLGNIPQKNIDSIAAVIARYYGAEVQILKPLPLPKHAFTQVKSPRYRADILLAWLKQNKPEKLSHVLAVTSKDISTTKKETNGSIKKPAERYRDWGIFGLGYRPGCCNVVSDFRLKHPNDPVRLERLKKVALHEFGHNLGLPHCKSTRCVMKDAAESIRTIDTVDPTLCKDCKSKI